MSYFVEGVTNIGIGDSRVVRIGEYDELEAAIAAAKKVVDVFLDGQYADCISAGALFVRYQKSGQVPFIFSDSEVTINVPDFNHFTYAMRRCEEIYTPKTIV